MLRRFQGAVQSPLLRTVLSDGSDTNLHYLFQTLVDGVGVGGGQNRAAAASWRQLKAPSWTAQSPALPRESEVRGSPSLTTLRVVVVEEHHTLVTGSKPTFTELTQELTFFDLTNTYSDTWS